MNPQQDRHDERETEIRAVRLENGGVIIYDADNEDAWLQADEAVPFG